MRIIDPMFGRDIFAIRGTREQAEAVLKKRWPNTTGKPDERITSYGTHMLYTWKDQQRDDTSILFFDRRAGRSLIMHEVIHLAFDVFKSRGVAVTPDEHEAFCYYAEMIFYRVLWKLGML